MKVLSILLALFVCYHGARQKESPVKEFHLGKYHYKISVTANYSHDDNWNNEFYVIYRLGKAKEVCSAYKSAKRNDSTFIDGRYLLYNNRIVFIKHDYFYKSNPVAIDSSRITFYPQKNGDLILKEVIDFKNGQQTKKEY